MTDRPGDPASSTDLLPAFAGGDMLPSKPRAGRRARSRRRRLQLITGGVAALVLTVAVVAIAMSGGDDTDAKAKETSTSKPDQRRSGKGADDSSSTTSSTTSSAPADTTPDQVEIPEPEVTEPPPEPTPSAEEIQANIGMQENLCDWDAGTGTLRSAGTLTNDNAVGYRIYVSVSWYAADGFELNGAADQFWVDPGGEPLDWELSNGLDTEPSGLRCEATFEVLN